jgi:hypothetical protein
MRPFSVQLGPTWPGVTAVTPAMYPETGMAELAERIQPAASSVQGVTLSTSEGGFWPHVSLCYAGAAARPRPIERSTAGFAGCSRRGWRSPSTGSTSFGSARTWCGGCTRGSGSTSFLWGALLTTSWSRTEQSVACRRGEWRPLLPLGWPLG